MQKHLTATVYICAKVDDKIKVLLHFHTKHQMWLGIGGHVELHENPVEALLRETKEESGLEIKLVNFLKRDRIKTHEVIELTPPYTILEEKITPYKDEPGHYHIDLIYFATTDTSDKVSMKEKWGWFSLPELKNMDLTGEVRHNSEKAIKVCSNII